MRLRSITAAGLLLAAAGSARHVRRVGAGEPFSPVAARWRVGTTFFSNQTSAARHSTGLVDTFDVFRRPGFETADVHPAIRRFYEDTSGHLLTVFPSWAPGVRTIYRMYGAVSRRIGQTDFPAKAGDAGVDVIGDIIAIDGWKPGLRAWIRTYSSDRSRAMYVAEYTTHTDHGVTYMDIAFPFPCGNLASILRPDPLPTDSSTGLILTTEDPLRPAGRAGIWVVSRRYAIPLPLHETLWIWAREMTQDMPSDLATRLRTDTTVVARHELRVGSLRYLTLDYVIAPRGTS